jgi:methylenetetrahydrofolate dehydrogenase (NADP+)/methenyltetrahydrofolate cyclohydrolase
VPFNRWETISQKYLADVDFADVESVVGAITPVPGGLGLITIAGLMKNTLTSACFQLEQVKVKKVS